MGAAVMHVGNEADATGIPFAGRVIQPLCHWQRLIAHDDRRAAIAGGGDGSLQDPELSRCGHALHPSSSAQARGRACFVPRHRGAVLVAVAGPLRGFGQYGTARRGPGAARVKPYETASPWWRPVSNLVWSPAPSRAEIPTHPCIANRRSRRGSKMGQSYCPNDCTLQILTSPASGGGRIASVFEAPVPAAWWQVFTPGMRACETIRHRTARCRPDHLAISPQSPA